MRANQSSGLTLMQMMVVIAIIGLLAAVAVPMYKKARTTAQTNACIQNQRELFLAVSAYETELNTNLSSIANNGVAIRNTIVASGYLKSNAFECTASPTRDYDDYLLRYSGTALTNT